MEDLVWWLGGLAVPAFYGAKDNNAGRESTKTRLEGAYTFPTGPLNIRA